MLENLIVKRGGLEGNNKSEYGNYLNQKEFEVFFQQIKRDELNNQLTKVELQNLRIGVGTSNGVL